MRGDMKLSEKVALIGLIGLFSVPFLIPIHSLPLTSFYTEWWAMLCGLLLFAPLVLSRNLNAEIQFPRIAWIFLAIAGLILMQMILGWLIYPSQGVLAILYLLWALLLMPAASALCQKHGRDRVLTTMAFSILVAGLINAVIGVFQAFSIHTAVTDILFTQGSALSVYGNIAQRNNYANFLAIALCAAMFLGYNNKLSWKIVALAGLCLVFGLALSGSRSVWLYLIAILFLALLLKARQPGMPANRLVWLSVLALVAFQLFQMALPLFDAGRAIATANSRLQEEAGESLPVRLALWQDAWHMFTSNPWFGVGYQNHAWHHLTLMHSGQSIFAGEGAYYEAIRWDHAHNIILQLMAELGIAAVPICLVAVWWLVRLIRGISSAQQWWLLSALAILCIHSLLEYPLWYANFLGIFVVLATLADDKPMKLSLPKASAYRLGLVFGVLGFGMLAFFQITYIALEKTLSHTHQAGQNQNFSSDFQQTFNSAQVNPFFEPQVDNILSQLPIIDSNQSGFINLQLDLNYKIIRYRADADSLYHRTALLWLAGHHIEAERWLERAIAIYPDSLVRYVQRAEFTYGNAKEMTDFLALLHQHQAKQSNVSADEAIKHSLLPPSSAAMP